MPIATFVMISSGFALRCHCSLNHHFFRVLAISTPFHMEIYECDSSILRQIHSDLVLGALVGSDSPGGRCLGNKSETETSAWKSSPFRAAELPV